MQANTLSAIFDRNGNVFDGFAPMPSESGEWNRREVNESNLSEADDTLTNFRFTLDNPHSIAARKFALKPEKKKWALCYDPECGPCFRPDIYVFDDCNPNTRSSTEFREISSNDTELRASAVFTGSHNFQGPEV
jgi:hypothetical protein